ncbi:MAG TPA: arylamine N-acetyltransferase [Jatrophihabitans sp.]|jgi:arylamine N-acetyltransferase|uniref:arylamine N-acetyltransferase family protein n=1 Tax=Jatrophihabitans sp. TaxID=1932789 RepID=UPI002DFFDBBC|nr:arylamine N-acetyltransferase [Jatrophihabitans sp.]
MIAVVFETAGPLDRAVRDDYLNRLGLDAEPPSVDGLRRLTRRQVERVPYETLWIAAGEAWDLDPHRSAARIARLGRGGYCYHLNGALGLLLTSLGYTVHGHVGGVHGAEGPTDAERGNHLVLTVDGLPTAANPAGVWYVDTGLGDALHDPLPLMAGPHDQPPFRLVLERIDDETWHLVHDPLGGFGGMVWTAAIARRSDFEAKHGWLSSSPESGFVRVPMAERRDATGVDVIRGLVLSRIGAGARTDEPVTRRADWFDVLADVFDLTFEASTPAARDRLWATVLAAHQAREAESEAEG